MHFCPPPSLQFVPQTPRHVRLERNYSYVIFSTLQILSSVLCPRMSTLTLLPKYYSPACIVYEWLTWCLTLREKLRLRVFQERLLSRILGFKTEEEAGSGTKLHNEELHKLCPPNTIRKVRSSRMIWAGHVANMGKKRSIKFMVGK